LYVNSGNNEREKIKMGKMHLVDLAGSERVQVRRREEEKKRRREESSLFIFHQHTLIKNP